MITITKAAESKKMTENQKTAGRPERNYGIDLLRLVTMMFICILHVCNKGGLTSHISQEIQPDHYRVVWFLEALTFGSVDIFSMISGYVGHDKKFKLSRPLYIWLELVFYTLIGTFLMTKLCPELLGENPWLRAAMPVMKTEYWYMTAYFGMVILSPFLNAALQKMSTRALGLTLLGVFAFYSLLPAVMDVSVFGLSSGYSVIWLCVMYLAGGFLARIKNPPHPLASFSAFLAFTLVTWLLRIKGASQFLKYTSPTVVAAAAALTLAFAGMKIRTRAAKAVIGFAAPSALGIFIIHVHNIIWEFKLKDAAVPFVSDGAWLMTLKALGMAAAIFFFCFAVDVVRRGIFRILFVKKLLAKLDAAAEKLFCGKNGGAKITGTEK